MLSYLTSGFDLKLFTVSVLPVSDVVYVQDITQQHLCDLTAVSLVEKCARFHIFCSEGLCEQDMAVFDPKINNENLTKCLQTLKEMYSDLSMKQNVNCPREAEFRSYLVLMNLNEGDILR